MASLIERFTSKVGQVIRVQHKGGEPIFCAKDVCNALGIVNHRDKVVRLDRDEKLTSVEPTPGQRRHMLFVTEPGLYSIILTCREATISGTPAHAFRRWVTHDVLPTIRRDRECKLRETIAIENHEEKGRRLWIVVRDMDVWNFNARRKHFGAVCNATARYCYTDEFNSPHVNQEQLEACNRCICETMSAAILQAVPPDQTKLTDFFSFGNVPPHNV